jgi:hypothetical protein
VTVHPAELGELEAMRDLFAAAPPKLAAELGAGVTQIAGALCISLRATPRSAMFNRVLGLGLAVAPTERDIETIDALYSNLEVDYCIALSPNAPASSSPTSVPTTFRRRARIRPGRGPRSVWRIRRVSTGRFRRTRGKPARPDRGTASGAY